MSKKKAYVRYANNKAVAGSLIVRTKAPKVGVWEEVPYDLCCSTKTITSLNSVSNTIFTWNSDVFFTLLCNSTSTGYKTVILKNLDDITSFEQLISFLNSSAPAFGTWGGYPIPNFLPETWKITLTLSPTVQEQFKNCSNLIFTVL